MTATRELVHRYFDDALDDEGLAELELRLASDPEARRLFVEMSMHGALLAEVMRAEAAGEAGTDARDGARGRRPPEGGGRFKGPYPSGYRHWAFGLGAAAAVALALGLAWTLRGRDSIPQDERRAYRIKADGRELARGSSLVTGQRRMKIELGGYCHIEVEPASVVRIEGEARAEEILLDRGGMVCDVDGGAGGFTVRTEMGTASVRGTQFTVRLLEEEGDNDVGTKRAMFVKVLAGAVLLSGSSGQTLLYAGEGGSLPGRRGGRRGDALPQTHAGYTALQPDEFDIWAGASPHRHDVRPAGEPTRQYLNGVWRLWKIKNDEALAREDLHDKAFEWWNERFAEKAEPQIVPMNWHFRYDNLQLHWTKKWHPTAQAGLYGVDFSVREVFKDRRVILHFDNVVNRCEVFLNGRPVGSHTNLFEQAGGRPNLRFIEKFEIDITPYVRWRGENELRVKVSCGPDVVVYRVKRPDVAGIVGPVWIDYRPSVFVRDLYLAPDTDSYVLKVDMVRDTPHGVSRKSDWEFIISPWDTKTGGRRYQVTKRIAWEGDLGHVEVAMPGAVFWDTERPFLYKLVVNDESGQQVARERFGFRTFRTQGEKFLLNGVPVFLRGMLITHCGVWETNNREYDKDHAMSEWLALRKEKGHLNHARIHTGSASSTFFDICDELGLLVSDEFQPPHTMLKPDDPERRPDYIAKKHVDALFDEKGEIKTEVLDRFKAMVLHVHNHPSVVLLNTGNEHSPDTFMYKYARAFYETVHRHDRQDRPISSWGSGVHLERADTVEELPTDYFDYHNYDESLGGGTWLSAVPGQRAEFEHSKRKAHLGDIPIINGETIGIWTRENQIESVFKRFAEGASPRDVFIEWSVNKFIPNLNVFPVHSRILGRIGIRAHTGLEAFREAHNRSFKQLLETERRELDFIQGILLLSGGNDEQFIRALGTVYAPLWVSAYPFRLNYFPGESLSLDALIHNGTLSPTDALRAEAGIYDGRGRAVESKRVPVDPLRPDERRKVRFALELPRFISPQKMTLRLALHAADGERSRNEYPISVLAQSSIRPRGRAGRVAVFEKADAPGGATVAGLFRTARIPFEPVDSVEDAMKAEVIVIGPGGMNAHLLSHGHNLTPWIEKGGKLAVFEQTYVGPYPFFPDYRVRKTAPRTFADPLVLEHPAFDGLDQESFRDWGGDGYVFTHWISKQPAGVDRSVLVGVASVPTRKKPAFAMLAAEIKLGEGAVYFSQLNAFQFYKKDAGAKRYVDNVLQYVLGREFGGKWAVPVESQMARVRSYSDEELSFVSLVGRMNSNFWDKVAGDGKGGWADLGRTNLGRMRTGKLRCYGVAFDVVKAGGENDWKSCIILGGSKRPGLPRSVEGIAVGEKLSGLAFLHTAMWVRAKPEEPMGYYVVHYDDGSRVEIPLRWKDNIGDWYDKVDYPNTMVAEIVTAPSGGDYAVYATRWDNPSPGKAIRSIDMRSEGNAILALLAITGLK